MVQTSFLLSILFRMSCAFSAERLLTPRLLFEQPSFGRKAKNALSHSRIFVKSHARNRALFGGIELEGKTLVSVQECLLASQTKLETDETTKIVFVDGSWYHNGERNGRQEYEQGPRIKGAHYIDMDDLACQFNLFPLLNPKNLPHMLPPAILMAAAMDAMNIYNNDHIIVYGKDGCFFTPRAWFLFYAMGHNKDRVHLMQGSLEEWMELGGSIETHIKNALNVTQDLLPLKDQHQYEYQAHEATNTCDLQFLLKPLNKEEASPILLDARGSSFQRNGYIPGAIQIPYESLVEPSNSLKFKPSSELMKHFQNAGVDVTNKNTIICTCGSGVSVCNLLVALRECGRSLEADSYKTVMYDGSWIEWGADPNTPKVEGVGE